MSNTALAATNGHAQASASSSTAAAANSNGNRRRSSTDAGLDDDEGEEDRTAPEEESSPDGMDGVEEQQAKAAAALLGGAAAAAAHGGGGNSNASTSHALYSDGKASTSAANPTEDTNGGGVGDKQQKKKVKVGARASIACKTCRKRKVRCSAEWPVCRFCTARKLPCVYEGHPAENGGPIAAGPAAGWAVAPAPATTTEAELPSAQVLLEALDAFITHYYDTFPFIHRPNLTAETNDDRAPKELLSCILALAARFCSPLRDLHPNAPSAAAEHYAQLAAHLLTLPETQPGQTAPPPPSADTPISLMRCQCHLLLGFYELTAGRDNSGWLKIGTAIRMAQTLRLGFDDEVPVYDDPDNPLSTRGRAIAAAQQDPIRAESRRRTFWALFLLDRTVSDGNERPCGLKVPRIASLRMPGSDTAFLAGRKSLGARFDPDPPSWAVSELMRSAAPGASHATASANGIAAPSPAPPPAEEPEADLYGYTLRIAEIWSKVASYIGSGGRNVDRRPPWLEESTFAQLARELSDFEARLPEELKYSQRTLTAHCLVPEDAKHFALLHLVNAMARHVLHRDYLPFLPPPGFKAANGPVDGEPLYGTTVVPSGWWQESFDMAAKSANVISDVCSHINSHGIILTHPFAGFAAVAAGTVHSHLKYWPQSSSTPIDATHYLNQDAEVLAALRNIYPIASRWYDSLAGLQLLYFNLARGVIDADPFKVRAGVLQLLRSAKDDADVHSPTTTNESPTPGLAAAHASKVAATSAASSKGGAPPLKKKREKAPTRKESSSSAAQPKEASRSTAPTLNNLVNQPAPSTETPGTDTTPIDHGDAASAYFFPGPGVAGAGFPFPFAPAADFATLAPEYLPGDFAFDLPASASSFTAALGGTLDDWSQGYGNWGLAGFGGLGAGGLPGAMGGAGVPGGTGMWDGMSWNGL
ncbi:hypothetical protein JCM10908_001281 [Rhodotorula pacifica]|uniref:Zn(II)2Cys6 transcription factor n=1 Tax=Rhodotorula pacifica TaxID=1495444 RepID=UPI00316D256E